MGDPWHRLSSAFQENDWALYCHWSFGSGNRHVDEDDLAPGIQPGEDDMHVLNIAGLEPVMGRDVVVPVLADPARRRARCFPGEPRPAGGSRRE